MGKIKCAKCNNLIDSNVSFCPHCGEKNINAGFYSYKCNPQNSGRQHKNNPYSNSAIAKPHIFSPKLWSKKKKIIVGIIAVILVIGIIGAVNEMRTENSTTSAKSGKAENSLVGTWNITQDKDERIYTKMVLYSNGSCSIDGHSGVIGDETEQGKWSITDGKLRITNANGGSFFALATLTGDYKINGNTLTLTNVYMDGELIDGYLIYEKEMDSLQKYNSNDCPDDIILSIINQQIEKANNGVDYDLINVALTNKAYSSENGMKLCNFSATAKKEVFSHDSFNERFDGQLLYTECHNLSGTIYFNDNNKQWMINDIEDEKDGRSYDFSPLIGIWKNMWNYTIEISSVSKGYISKMGQSCNAATTLLKITNEKGEIIGNGEYYIKPLYNETGSYIDHFSITPVDGYIRPDNMNTGTIDAGHDAGLYFRNKCVKEK